jgi:hypothetical protein
MLPTFIASIIGGPDENSTHFTSMPGGPEMIFQRGLLARDN